MSVFITLSIYGGSTTDENIMRTHKMEFSPEHDGYRGFNAMHDGQSIRTRDITHDARELIVQAVAESILEQLLGHNDTHNNVYK